MVLTAVAGLVDVPALLRMWRVSRIDFYAAVIALVAVLLLGIMLHELHGELDARGIALRIVGARGRVRDLLRADGLSDKIGGLDRVVTLASLVGGTSR